LGSSERSARLLAAAGGDAEHAARIEHVLEDLRAHSKPPANVIRLPRVRDDWLDSQELEAELEPSLSPAKAWAIAAAIGLVSWAILAGLAFLVYRFAFGR